MGRRPAPLRSDQSRVSDLVGEVVLAAALAVDVRRRAVETTTEGVGVTEGDRDDVHAQLVHLLHLVDLAGLDTHGLVVDDEAVHG